MQLKKKWKSIPISLLSAVLITLFLISMISCKNNDEKAKNDLNFNIDLDVIIHHWDGVFNWTQTRVGAIPDMGKKMKHLKKIYKK